MVPEWITSGGVAAFHQPKSKSSSRERLRAGGDSGVPSEDDDDDDHPCISRSSPECHGTECDHGAEGGHDHFHLRVGSSSSGDFRSKSSLRNDRYKCFGLLESNILNSFQLKNFRRKNGSEYDSANSSGVLDLPRSSTQWSSLISVPGGHHEPAKSRHAQGVSPPAGWPPRYKSHAGRK